MISAEDFVRLPYSPDLTEGGIAYVCRARSHMYDRAGSVPLDRLRRSVAGVAVELAFRRYLAKQELPFAVTSATPFTDPERYVVSLGGRRCDIRSFLISRRKEIASLQADPALLLEAPALVPLDQFSADGQSADDIYVFSFLTGTAAASSDEIDTSLEAGQSLYLIHAMPAAWARPQVWIPLRQLALKSESDQVIRLELGGQGGDREFITRSMELPPRRRCELDVNFYSLSHVHADPRPGGRLGISLPLLGVTHIIEPDDWGDIWLSGLDIFLVGWITRDDFRQRSSLIPAGRPVFQFSQTREKNLAVRVSDLKPLEQLLDRVRHQRQ